MKRRLTKLAVFLLLGAIVNVAGAWGIAWNQRWWVSAVWQPPEKWERTAEPDAPRTWFYVLAQRPGATGMSSWSARTDLRARVRASVAFGDLPTVRSIDRWNAEDSSAPAPPYWTQPRRWFTGNEQADSIAIHHEFAAGWPACSLRAEFSIVSNADDTKSSSYGRLRIPRWTRQTGAGSFVPFFPICIGFLVNTLFYGAGLYAILLGPLTLVRLMRRRRGLCIKCGYDLRGDSSSGCPECGWRRGDVS